MSRRRPPSARRGGSAAASRARACPPSRARSRAGTRAAAFAAVLAAAVPTAGGCAGDGTSGASAGAPPPRHLVAEVVAEHPFAASWFTQGLELRDGDLLVGTGLRGESALRVVRDPLGSPAVAAERVLPADHFGEGVTAVGDEVWQLTWTAGVAHRFRGPDLSPAGIARYDGEGWGLCHLPSSGALVMSDGSDRLTLRDPADFSVRGAVDVVRGDGGETDDLNELECVERADLPAGAADLAGVWANRWRTEEILLVDPATGAAAAVADASALRDRLPEDARAGADVLNGIAHVPGTDRFLLSGKLWPTLFEVRFRPAESGR
ncbi:glutaminyl-peptide cyclotransferase [Corynebacterium sp.]|uniref:glutaminyl-peptide cyclotransferase n=1 Tax=Corynebacterium sp. TaxID=1720 RepID=UPI0026DA70A2|nr:glutaminyl-peptide cyclotransferase [Corynebacterium sp.]MDO4610510.1 glutaminyl-peptide cyclotransferase [Corynebacterium sp.]